MISSTTNKVIYNGDGTTTTFAYTFKIFQDSDLKVYLQDTTTLVETLQTLNSDYTVTGAGDDSGGNVVFVSAPSSSYKVIINRSVPMTQAVDYVPNDPFPAETHEDALDKLTMLVQQLQEQLDRALLRDLSQTTSLTLPALSAGYLHTDGTDLDWTTGSFSLSDDTSPQLGGDLDTNGHNIDSVTPTELGYLHGVTSAIQTQLNAKGTLSNIVEDTTPQLGGDLDTNGNNIDSVTPTELGYLHGVTSAIQTQINAKMSGLVDDTSPQLGGNLDLNGNVLSALTANQTGVASSLLAQDSGVTVAEVNDGGIVDFPKQSRVRAGHSTAQTIATATATKLQYDTEIFDNQSEYDNSTNYRFTATKAGEYYVDGHLVFDSCAWSAGNDIQLILYKNGSAVSRLDYSRVQANITTFMQARGADVIYLSAGDYVELYILHGRGSDTDTYGDTMYSFFSISKLN